MEMILDIEIFREGPDTPKDSVFVPLVFPLIAGAGALTTLLSIRAQFADINVLLAIVCIVLSVLSVGFAIKLIPVAIACVVCMLSAVYVAPSLWTMFEKTETEKIEK